MYKTGKKWRSVAKTTVAGLVAVLLICILSNCTPGAMDVWELKVTFTNNSSEEVHLFGQGNSGGPGNKVQPGKSRSESYREIHRGNPPPESFTAVAFKNGQVISTRTYGVTYTFDSVHNNYYAELSVSYPW